MKTILVIAAALWSASCRSEFPDHVKDTDKLSTHMTYFTDTNGICYAALESLTAYGYMTASITSIPCEKMPKNKK
jgi:hypothetical protein